MESEKYIKERGNEGWFGSPGQLNQATRKKSAKKYLATQDSYTLNRRVVRKFPRRRVIAFDIDHIWEADLLQISGSKGKKGFQNLKYILTTIDIVSKRARTRQLANKTTSAVTKAFENILMEGTAVPMSLYTDRGTEFMSSQFQKMLKKWNIHWYTTNSPIKGAVIERFNRSLMGRISRYLTHYPPSQRKKSHNMLQNITDSYNKSFHRSIKMPPSMVSERNIKEVLQNLYPEEKHELPVYTIGQTVRIALDKTLHKKGYRNTFSKEKYVIKQVKNTKPPTYLVNGKKRAYYKQELQLVL